MTKAVACQFNVFENSKVRSVIYNGKLFFSIVDVIAILTESLQPSRYWNELKKEVERENGKGVFACTEKLKLVSEDGKMRLSDCADMDGIFEIMLDVPSKKARPFKKWISKVGSDYVQGNLVPAHSVNSKSLEWLKVRADGKEARKTLAQRAIDLKKTGGQIANMTNQIYRGAFDMDRKAVSNNLGLSEKANLRDNLTAPSLHCISFGEQVATNTLLKTESSSSAGKDGKEATNKMRRVYEDYLPSTLLRHEMNNRVLIENS